MVQDICIVFNVKANFEISDNKASILEINRNHMNVGLMSVQSILVIFLTMVVVSSFNNIHAVIFI